MSGFKFVIVDTDETFALKIQDKLEKMVPSDAEIVIVTELTFFESMFSVPQKIDTLLIRKELYSKDLEKHSIDSICIITDSIDECSEHKDGYIKYIYRFSPISEITLKMIQELDIEYSKKATGSSCRIVSVVSPCGGSGKTVFALALCHALRSMRKKVLYIDSSNMQTSSYWLGLSQTDDMELLDSLSCLALEDAMNSKDFDYIKPFTGILSTLGINSDIYVPVLEQIKSSGKYDFIVIDTDSVFSEGIIKFISKSTDVFVLSLQDKISVDKLGKFIKSIDCTNNDKYKFVCNCYRHERKDYMKSFECISAEYNIIPFLNIAEEPSLKETAKMQCFKKFAAMLS